MNMLFSQRYRQNVQVIAGNDSNYPQHVFLKENNQIYTKKKGRFVN